MGRARRAVTTAVGLVVLAGASWLPGVATEGAAAPPGGISLLATQPTLVVTRAAGQSQVTPLGVAVVADARRVEMWTTRRTYGSTRSVTLTIRTDAGRRLTSTRVPSSLVTSLGLSPFGTVTVSQGGFTMAQSTIQWCPGVRAPFAAGGSAGADPVYPPTCRWNPFALASVSGLAPGWASMVTTRLVLPATLPDGDYQVDVTVDAAMASRLQMTTTGRRASFTLQLTTADTPAPIVGATGLEAAVLAETRLAHELAAAPVPRPPRDTLPDIASLPAYAMGTTLVDGRDVLTFAANTWNRGPGPLVVEGYRIEGTELMDASQIFHRNGVAVGSTPIGQMLFHHGEGHDHWHFTDFARYDLTDTRKRVVATSGKQSWCLAPTDPIDLRVRGAIWRPESTSLVSACGGIDAQWLRQVLPVGWGDTYTQKVAGQAIDITALANGRYYLKVTANPEGAIHEVTRANNVSYRLVILGGTPGARTVTVPPHRRIDTG